MVVFSNYDDCKLKRFNNVSISFDGGRSVGFFGEVCKKLAPSEDLMVDWAFYQGRCVEETINRYFIERYYKEVLKNLDVVDIYRLLDNKVVLDYDKCPTRLAIMAWLEIFLGIETTNWSSSPVAKGAYIGEEPQNYIKEFLEEQIKENENMYGFNSPQAAFLYRKSLEMNSKSVKEPNSIYMQYAAFLRCDADEAEEKYLNGKKNEQQSTEKFFEEIKASEMWLEEQGHKLCYTPINNRRQNRRQKEIAGQMHL